MFYIVALGNPGEKYADTRHNVGWQVVEYCLEQWGFPALVESNKFSGLITQGEVGGEEVTILLPTTYMNNSGSAVVKLVPKNEIDRLTVVHDDVDLPLGQIKITKGRGGGGNNGVASIIKKLGTKDFVRVRVGIAPKSFLTGKVKRPQGGGPLERFVLKPFTSGEKKKLNAEVYSQAERALVAILTEGAQKAMNKFN